MASAPARALAATKVHSVTVDPSPDMAHSSTSGILEAHAPHYGYLQMKRILLNLAALGATALMVPFDFTPARADTTITGPGGRTVTRSAERQPGSTNGYVD